MITDINELDDSTVIEADICIIGGGAVGITMAREFANTHLDVCVLESGGFEYEAGMQSLYVGETSGVPYFDLTDCRCRIFGGSTYRWGARGAPMDEIDFKNRSWTPHSGWPVSLAEMRPYYERAQKLNGMYSPFHYDERVWESFDIEPPVFDKEFFHYWGFQFGKIIMFGSYYREELKSAPNVNIFLNANVTNIQSNSVANHIDYVDVITLQGKKSQVKAKTFVLASGGIENPRLMLVSNTVEPEGLCNSNDLVGRFFMEHPTTPTGTVITSDMHKMCDYFSPGQIGGRLVETGLALSEKLQETEKCLNAVVSVRPELPESEATQVFIMVVWDFMHRRIPENFIKKIGQILKDPFRVAANCYRHVVDKPKRFNTKSLYLEVRIEQEPNPDSRVTLSDKKDVLGMRYPRLHWDLTEMDKHTMKVAAEAFGRECERLGIGQFIMDDWLTSNDLMWSPELVGGHHHMGTTRMSDSESEGVVDKNLKAHTMDNLYIAGSSVFPTAGYVNPTLTVLALTLRLTDHLKAILKQ